MVMEQIQHNCVGTKENSPNNCFLASLSSSSCIRGSFPKYFSDKVKEITPLKPAIFLRTLYATKDSMALNMQHVVAQLFLYFHFNTDAHCYVCEDRQR